jgi:mannose-6-phosphate isomerase-like protein (cupin superfamily)
MTDVIVLDAARDLVTATTSQRFDGHAHGGVGVSFFLNHTPPGRGAGQHRHPYAEVFVLHDGEAVFTVDGVQLRAHGGQVVVVPAQAAHGFENPGPGRLEMTSIHPVAEMATEWLAG